MATPTEVIAVRLYWKSPGSGQLRKSSAAELATLEAAGWQEKHRTNSGDHTVVRMERPRPARQSLHSTQGGQGGQGRPRR
jgi:hypothetical protein